MFCTSADVVAVSVHLDSGQVPAAARAYLGGIACAAVAVAADLQSAMRVGELLVAVMDRETHCGAMRGRDGSTGPSILHFDGHGMGLFGADDRSHPVFDSLKMPDGSLAVFNPAMAALYAAGEIEANLRHYKRAEAPALAAYNGGPGRVDAALKAGHDVDSVTTGSDKSPTKGDYSKDVLERAAQFYPCHATPAQS
jgi:hypothetical protein